MGFKSLLKTLVILSIINSCYGAITQNIFIFGDSLSDGGYANNFYKTDSGWPKVPGNPKLAKQATFTSPISPITVWPQYLAETLDNSKLAEPNNINSPKINIHNKSVTPVLAGSNYAAGGAATVCQGFGKEGEYKPPAIGPLISGQICPKGQDDIQSHNQIDSYLSQNNSKADPDAIYIIWGGANNAFLLLQNFSENTSTFAKLYQLFKSYVATNINISQLNDMKLVAKDIAYDAQYLINHGASPSNIYIINLPDLGITPEATDNGKNLNDFKTRLFSSFSKVFNEELKTVIPSGVHIINAQRFFSTIAKNKKIKVDNVEYDFSNVTQSACDFEGTNALKCIPKDYTSGKYNKYLFADQVHPTSYAHMVLAKYILNELKKE